MLIRPYSKIKNNSYAAVTACVCRLYVTILYTTIALESAASPARIFSMRLLVEICVTVAFTMYCA